MQAREAAIGWLPVQDAQSNPTDQYAVDYIMVQRGSGDSAIYLLKWRGALEDRATWEPAAHLADCLAFLRAWRRRIRKQQRPLSHTAPASIVDSPPS